MPTKIFEFHALSRPIICCSNGAVGNYVQTTKSGLVVPCNKLFDLISAIRKLKNEPNICKEYGMNGKKVVDENLTFKKIGVNLKRILLSLN